MKMNKKAEMPWWLLMLIMSLATLALVLVMLKFQGDKFTEWLRWLG